MIPIENLSVKYDEQTKTLTAYCCDTNVTVERNDSTYKIFEKQYGKLCGYMCEKKVTIFNAPNDAKVEFVDKDGNQINLK